MLQIKFATRHGGPRQWGRAAVLQDSEQRERIVPIVIAMKETGSERIVTRDGERVVIDDRKRNGVIRLANPKSEGEGDELGKVLWEGPVGLDATPLRATCVAAGLVDTEGNPLDWPKWASNITED